MSLTVELVYDKDCPHVAATRANLLRALRRRVCLRSGRSGSSRLPRRQDIYAASDHPPCWSREAAVAAKAKTYGIRSVPAVVNDGKLTDCCAGRGPEEASLRAAGLGRPLP